eukprot:augustus_masked-scaffold_11-processed-gene-7.54-mRNA-1 protein AED:0.00 eAED:0.00 QI:32/0/0.5/1/0/0.5/2/48/243
MMSLEQEKETKPADLDFWESKWSKNPEKRQIGFHESAPHPFLVKYYKLLTNMQENANILVPFCGKTPDLRFLLDEQQTFFKNSEVLGIEYVETAVLELAEDEKFSWEQSETDGDLPGFKVFTSTNEIFDRLTIYQGDFYGFLDYPGENFDLCYDRASLVAIEPRMRPKYTEIIKKFCKEVFLIVFEYKQEEKPSPPYSVSEIDVNELFADKYNIQRVESRDMTERWPMLSKMTEVLYRLSLKD